MDQDGVRDISLTTKVKDKKKKIRQKKGVGDL